MSELSGGGSAGFQRPVASITTQIQQRQAQIQEQRKAAVSEYGTPLKGDSFTRTVQEHVVSAAIPQNHPFRSDLSKSLYPRKGETAAKANPFAQQGGDLGALALDKQIDWSARQKFGEDPNSVASLS